MFEKGQAVYVANPKNKDGTYWKGTISIPGEKESTVLFDSLGAKCPHRMKKFNNNEIFTMKPT